MAQQRISGSWWLLCTIGMIHPYGIQSEWGTGSYRPEQTEITDQMLMRKR